MGGGPSGLAQTQIIHGRQRRDRRSRAPEHQYSIEGENRTYPRVDPTMRAPPIATARAGSAES